jgi:hypothetical protein
MRRILRLMQDQDTRPVIQLISGSFGYLLTESIFRFIASIDETKNVASCWIYRTYLRYIYQYNISLFMYFCSNKSIQTPRKHSHQTNKDIRTTQHAYKNHRQRFSL